jgi:hypothetical protein
MSESYALNGSAHLSSIWKRQDASPSDLGEFEGWLQAGSLQATTTDGRYMATDADVAYVRALANLPLAPESVGQHSTRIAPRSSGCWSNLPLLENWNPLRVIAAVVAIVTVVTVSIFLVSRAGRVDPRSEDQQIGPRLATHSTQGSHGAGGPTGFRRVFSTGFDSPFLAGDSWEIDTGIVRARDGELQLVGGSESTLGKDVSSGVSFKHNQTYGRWELGFQVDRGAGYSAVIALSPDPGVGQTSGVIVLADVSESDRKSGLNLVRDRAGNINASHEMNADFSRPRTISVELLPGRVAFYLDGVQQYALDVVRSADVQSLESIGSPMHLLLRLNRTCVSAECRSTTTENEVVMRINWFRMWTLE